MKRSKVYNSAVCILLAVLVVSGCATPKTIPVPTFTAQPTPVVQKASPAPKDTAQPTPIVQKASPTPYPLITITFSAGDKCSIAGPTTLTSGLFHVDVVVESWDHDKYGLGVGNIPVDKTTKELQDSANKHIYPDWLNIIDYQEFIRGIGMRWSFLYYTSSTQGPLIFSCFWMDNAADGSGEGEALNFETLGPIPVVKAP